MIERFLAAPWSFWLHLLVLAILVIEGLRKWNHPWAKPALVIYGTVAFWYTGDFLLATSTDYQAFAREVVSLAFLQVTFFLGIFRFALVGLSRRFCERPLQEARRQVRTAQHLIIGGMTPRLLRNLLVVLILAWLVILGIGVALSPGLWYALLWPPLHHEKVGMYPLVGLGGGMSFAYNAIGYIHVLICALFGVVAVMARGPVRWIAAAMVLVTWPYFWFDRTRNKMLALMLPGLAAFLLVGKKSVGLRISVVIVFGLGISLWFARVASYRADLDTSTFLESSTAETEEEQVLKRQQARQGQDMLKELCWVNTLIPSGRFRPNWGGRYFAEIVNPIPRAIWPGKPMVGIDYSIARGFGGARGGHGVFATISTGMIGQGCVNFGRFLGPPAAALLFALWAAFLARLWCQRSSPFRLALFLVGLGLTLNTGRDLTFLVLFPFAFGYLALRLYEQFRRPVWEWRSVPRTAPNPALAQGTDTGTGPAAGPAVGPASKKPPGP